MTLRVRLAALLLLLGTGSAAAEESPLAERMAAQPEATVPPDANVWWIPVILLVAGVLVSEIRRRRRA